MGLVLTAPTVAFVAGPHLLIAPAVLGPIGGALGGVFHLFGGLVLGGLSWTVGVAGKFILNTLGGLIRLLIPASWAKDGLQVMHWIVAVPDYAGTITTPSGHVTYGFAGINALRDLFMWVGAALLPLTLVYATSRAALGAGHTSPLPVVRVLALAAVLVSYPWWWSQAAAAVNQITQFVLALPPVSHGIYKLMQYAVGGVALGGWQLIDLFLMGAIGSALLGLIFLKVVIVLLGALLYAIGPLMIALVPTDGGIVIARAWASAALALLMLPLAWSTILAVGALLINDSSTAGPLIAGQGSIASLLGGLLLAFAGLASLWLCIRAAREAGAVLRGQLGGMLVLGRLAPAPPPPPRRRPHGEPRNRLRSFAGRIAGATGAALSAAGPPGQAAGIRSPRVRGPQPARPTRRRRRRDPHRRTRRRAGHGGARRPHPRGRNGCANGSRRHRKLADPEDAGPNPRHDRPARTHPHRVPRAAAAPDRNGQAPTRQRPDADRAARSNASSRGRPVYAAPPGRASRTAKRRRPCASQRPNRQRPAQPTESNKPGTPPRPDRANSQPPTPKRASRPAPRRQPPRKGT